MLRRPYVYFAMRGGIGGVQKNYIAPREVVVRMTLIFLSRFFFFLSITDSQPIRNQFASISIKYVREYRFGFPARYHRGIPPKNIASSFSSTIVVHQGGSG